MSENVIFNESFTDKILKIELNFEYFIRKRLIKYHILRHTRLKNKKMLLST